MRIGYSTNSWVIVNQITLQSPPVNSWAFYNISFSQLGACNLFILFHIFNLLLIYIVATNVVRGIHIQSNTQAYLGDAYIDDMALVPK